MDLLTILALSGAAAGWVAGGYAALWNWVTYDEFLGPMLHSKLAKRRALRARRRNDREMRRLRP